ncbi:GIN domain-containing protein [Riemerella columbipharyngis]|uniref:Putative auto-transporter adhesin, head GIN domain n=1 Tax=Riemerella columbipharyngis TaxID=1071918 RepID=A0A1G7BW59_9FLAO|nr:DUF2807 domain-containing protein [Riemerella columbipharyngis]SDE30616.1 Putative auto-transporter adhesin, head GIN domain [Riemerella columbipharyngis]
MKYFCYIWAVFAVISCSKLKPEGKIQDKQIELSAFNKLNLVGKYRLFYVPSQQNFVDVETYSNFIDNLDINVKDSTLNITEKRETGGVDFYTVTVYTKNPLTKIAISDSVEMNVSGELDTPHLNIELKKQGKFIGAIRTPKAVVNMFQKSRANFSGVTQNATLNISDTASVIAPYWEVGNLVLHSKNENYAELSVNHELSGFVENTAKLTYYGDPVRNLKIGKQTDVVNKEKP